MHVAGSGHEAKFWIDPVAVARSGGFRPVQLNEIGRIVEENRAFLLDVWHRERAKHGHD